MGSACVGDVAGSHEPGLRPGAVALDLFGERGEVVEPDRTQIGVTAHQEKAGEGPGEDGPAADGRIAELEHAGGERLEQVQVQSEAGCDLGDEQAVEVPAEDVVGVQPEAVHQREVGEVGACVVGGPGALAGLVSNASVQVQADQQRLGEPVLQVRPVLEEAVVEVAAGLDRCRSVSERRPDPGEVLLPRRVTPAVAWFRGGCEGERGHRLFSNARV